MADAKADGMHRFETGAVRGSDPGLARRELVPVVGWRRMAEACGYGVDVKGYPVGNWTKGIPSSNLLRHALDHIAAYIDGDRSEDHLGHALWNLAVTAHNEERRPDMHDVGPLRQIPDCDVCGKMPCACGPAHPDERAVPESQPYAGFDPDGFGAAASTALARAGYSFSGFFCRPDGATAKIEGITYLISRSEDRAGTVREECPPRAITEKAMEIAARLRDQGLWGNRHTVPESGRCPYCGEPHGPAEPHAGVPPVETDRRRVPESGLCADPGEVIAEVFPPELPADSFGRRCWEALKAAGIPFADFSEVNGHTIFRWMGPPACRFHVKRHRSPSGVSVEDWDYPKVHGEAAAWIQRALEFQGLWDPDRRRVPESRPCADSKGCAYFSEVSALRRAASTAANYLRLCDSMPQESWMPEGRRTVLGGLVEAIRGLDAAPAPSISPGPMGSGAARCCHCLGDHPTSQCPELGG